jgi:hypothetical protein
MDYNNKIIDIYTNKHNQSNYLITKTKEFEKKLNYKITAEDILNKLETAHVNGYGGFHFIDNKYPNEVIDNYMIKLFNNDYICSRYCKYHDKMILFINPVKLGLYGKSQKESYENDGKRFIDFCYDL